MKSNLTFIEALTAKRQNSDSAAKLEGIKPDELKVVVEALYQGLTSKSNGKCISLQEALTTRDFPQILQTTMDTRLLPAEEPEYIGQALLADTINVGKKSGIVNIPAFTNVEASEIGETQEYPEQSLEFIKHATSIIIRKFGVRVAISELLLEMDEMGLFGMHLLAAKAAMLRLKEEKIFSLFKNNVGCTFDNAIAFTAEDLAGQADLASHQPAANVQRFATTGRDINGAYNATLHIFDVINTMAALLADGYTPSDMCINPLSWPIFAQDPVLNGFYNNMRAMPSQIAGAPAYSAKGPNDLSRIPLPWAMNLHVTKFVPAELGDGSVPILTDIYMGSRNNGVVIVQGSPLSQDSYSTDSREILNVRLREYYGLGIADLGRPWRAIKNVRIDRAYEPVVIKTITD